MGTRQTKIEVTGDTSKYERSMLQTERISRKASKSIMSAFSGVVGLFAGGLGIAKVISSMTEMVQLAEVQRKAVGGMETAMRSMGRYTPEMSAQLQKYATGLQQVSNYGDEATLTGTKFLMTYRKITDDLMPRSQVAMLDLAALMGGDTVRAANMLGKAAMGMTGELRRVGISVDSATYKTEGYLGVLKAIESQVGGQAAAMRDPWTQLGNVVGDAKESLGGFVSVAFEGYADDMIRLLPELSKSWQELAKSVDETRQVEARYYIERLQRQLEGKGVMADMGGFGADFMIAGSDLSPKEEGLIRSKLERYQAIIKEISDKSKASVGGGGDGEGVLPWHGMDDKQIAARQKMIEGMVLMENEVMAVATAERLELETEQRETEIATLVSSAEYKRALLQSEHDVALAMITTKNDQEVALELDRIKKIENLEKQSARSRQSIFMNLGMAMLNFAGVNSEAIFAVQKGFEVGLAVMAAFTASNLALATPPGPPYTAPLAAATLKAGLLNAGIIAATAIGQAAASGNTGATGAGSYVSPVVTAPVSAPATVADPAISESKPTYTIYVDTLYGSEEYVQHLAELISESVENNDVRLVASQAQRIGD
jgi:hypothetical protein